MSIFTELQNHHNNLLSRQTEVEKQKKEALRILHEKFTTHFSREDLKLLCFDLGLNFDDLPGETMQSKVQSIVWWSEQQGSLSHLLEILGTERPNIAWPSFEKLEIEKVEEFIQEGKQKSTQIYSLPEREQLQANLSFWAWYIYEQTGIKPNDDLFPPQDPPFSFRLQRFIKPRLWFLVLLILGLLLATRVFIFQKDSGNIVCPPELGTMVLFFIPESAELTFESRRVLDNCVIPMLTENENLLLYVRGSSAWPANEPPWTEADILEVAEARAQSVVDHFLSQGFDRDRFIIETILPPEENRNTDDVNIQAKDRFVELVPTEGR